MVQIMFAKVRSGITRMSKISTSNARCLINKTLWISKTSRKLKVLNISCNNNKQMHWEIMLVQLWGRAILAPVTKFCHPLKIQEILQHYRPNILWVGSKFNRQFSTASNRIINSKWATRITWTIIHKSLQTPSAHFLGQEKSEQWKKPEI